MVPPIFKAHTRYKKLLADTLTPVSIYLKIRDRFPNSILLESSDYHGNENSYSYVCFNPVATIVIENEKIIETFPDGTNTVVEIDSAMSVPLKISAFAGRFSSDTPMNIEKVGVGLGLFGYIGYDSVRYFENIQIEKSDSGNKIPDIVYSVYQNIIAINHFKNEAYIFSHDFSGKEDNIQAIETLVFSKNFASYSFTTEDTELSNFTDEEFLGIIHRGQEHCYRGDVFQIVLSRRFIQKFRGDDFNVYRALRSINPSPYLFYFDYGSFKIFGSSPEAQLVVNGNQAAIHPIAGTFRRTGNDREDMKLAQKLHADAKENAEHMMLVDLARNDLARNGSNVTVEKHKEVQYFSHVIHLVSKVVAEKNTDVNTMQLVADTFPAGTLSGAPKHRAMQLIEMYEKDNRSFYGGCIGFLDFNGNFNHAIIIRSFCCRDNTLYYQAGAGVVAASSPESELQEVYNKIAVLRQAIEMAQTIEK